MSKRKYILVGIKRALLEETVYRCASCLCSIEHCEDDDTFYKFYEKAHIDSHNKTQDDSFENLITLCPTCHTKFDKNPNKEESIKRLKALKQQWLNASGKYSKFELDCLLDLYKEIQYPWTKYFVIPDYETTLKITQSLSTRADKLNNDPHQAQNMTSWQYGLQYTPTNLLNKLSTIDLDNQVVIKVLQEINLNKKEVEKMREQNKHFVLSLPDVRNLVVFRNIIQNNLVFINTFTGETVVYITDLGKQFCEKFFDKNKK